MKRRVLLFNENDSFSETDKISFAEEKHFSKREEILKEINADKVVIDKECFKKSFIEKKQLKEAKSSYKKQKNNPKFIEEKNKLINQMIKSNTFDCGNLIFNFN